MINKVIIEKNPIVVIIASLLIASASSVSLAVTIELGSNSYLFSFSLKL